MSLEETEEDDYMSMAIAEPEVPKQKETYTQRRIRKQREAEAKSHAPSASAKTTAALSTALPETSKGALMLAKLGYKPGSALGARDNPNARIEPLGVAVKEDRGGVGLDSERKRKFREEAEGEMERERAEEGGYRERVAREREERRREGLIRGAQVVLEGFEGESGGENGRAAEEEAEKDRDGADPTAADNFNGISLKKPKEKKKKNLQPTRQINILWRGLVRQREEKERDRRMRYDLLQSLSRNATYDDPEEDEHDRHALGKEEEDLDEEDPELEAFNALDSEERLRQLVEHLRGKYLYCLWCKHRYEDKAMEGCPGLTEDDHD